LQAWTGEGVAFTAFGAPVFNAGMGVVPATLQAEALASQGVLAFALRQGRLLEARWFPDEPGLEDRHFGGEPIPDGPTPAERAFEAAAAASKMLRKAPDNDTLLALYSLYKQGSVGDVAGARPGVMDVVGRAKYDAWLARRGLPREQAMSEYVVLVDKLKAAEAKAA
jgi:carboxylesterase